ncbi:MAG TPA: tannase/feruloyl esterase family alpha/beta hydrolase [Stellaceae bacterium]|nr:tannase/feruloyl esterase family alpha/beta hydrolase [Stellaceae bacterium]
MKTFAFALVLALAACFGAVTGAWADTKCTGTISGNSPPNGPFPYSTPLMTITGNVTVPNGASCTLSSVNVTGNVQAGNGSSLTLSYVNISGNVQVQSGGTLLANAYEEPMTIGGNVQASNCSTALLEGNVTVGGNVQIQGCSGTGPTGFQGPDIVIKGNFLCQSNSGGCEAWLGTVSGNVQVQSNGVADVSLVTVGGNLQCQANAGTVTHNHGPSWVTGNTQGQCAGFSTTTTQIGTTVAPVGACANLMSLPGSGFPVPNSVIVSAVDTPAAAATATTPALPERCIVSGHIDDHISPVDNCEYQDGFQVQMPIAASWNGRFFMQGGGGTEGSVPTAVGTNAGGAPASTDFGIANGYAVATQDGGHENSEQKVASCDSGYGNANELYLDPWGTNGHGYQSIEAATLVAKYVINEYYGTGPAHSYWLGCSDGGRDGMVMSQNFPQYYDGIVAGDPTYDLESVEVFGAWGIGQFVNLYQTTTPPLPPVTTVPGPAPEAAEPLLYPAMPAADQALFETALLQACDALDGVADGVIDNLPACQATFNPVTATYTSGGTTYPLQCTGAKNATCLTSAQIQAVLAFEQGPRTTSGQPVKVPAGGVAPDHADNTVPGSPYDGAYMTTIGVTASTEGTATTPGVLYPAGETQFAYGFLTPPMPTFSPPTFNVNTDLGLLNPTTPISVYSTSLDINKFISYGHKIIWYHGLSDVAVPAVGTINYYDQMAAQHGGLAGAQSFSRLYPIPNMGHCSGGPATDQIDLLTPVVNWVEHGTAPGPITASSTATAFSAATYQVGFVTGAPDNAPTQRTRPVCPYPQEARFIGSTTLVGGVPVATNPADLANASNYTCITPSAPPYLQ